MNDLNTCKTCKYYTKLHDERTPELRMCNKHSDLFKKVLEYHVENSTCDEWEQKGD